MSFNMCCSDNTSTSHLLDADEAMIGNLGISLQVLVVICRQHDIRVELGKFRYPRRGSKARQTGRNLIDVLGRCRQGN